MGISIPALTKRLPIITVVALAAVVAAGLLASRRDTPPAPHAAAPLATPDADAGSWVAQLVEDGAERTPVEGGRQASDEEEPRIPPPHEATDDTRRITSSPLGEGDTGAMLLKEHGLGTRVRVTSTHADGSVWQTYEKVDGKIQGEMRTYAQSGVLVQVDHYDSGKHDGETRMFYESGELMAHGIFVDGRKTGAWVELWRNGQVRSTTEYENGRRLGPSEHYDQGGALLPSKE